MMNGAFIALFGVVLIGPLLLLWRILGKAHLSRLVLLVFLVPAFGAFGMFAGLMNWQWVLMDVNISTWLLSVGWLAHIGAALLYLAFARWPVENAIFAQAEAFE